MVVAVHDLLPDRLQQPPRPPLGLLHEPRRAMVTGVSSALHEEMRGHPASSASSPGPTRLGPRGRCQLAPVCCALCCCVGPILHVVGFLACSLHVCYSLGCVYGNVLWPMPMGTPEVRGAPRMAFLFRPVETHDGICTPLPPVVWCLLRVSGWFTYCGVV